ncbi:MAG: UDP-N-acetylmuramate dehydrogenase, partial [Chloroflexota bacterium]|nr:UDP-N-acetylmuramate dehydrogenase [Chloroflexota bacterium]
MTAVEVAAAPLSARTTLRLGGPARRLVVASSEAEVVATVRAADAAGEPVLVLGGGSNLVVADAGFDGVAVEVAAHGVELASGGGPVIAVTAQAGENWDDLVTAMVADGLSGIEALAGIPGRVGATPIQNVGAYGQDVSQTIRSVRVYDRRTDEAIDLAPAQCRFTYRNSVFKGDDRYVVLAVTYELRRTSAGSPVRYAELARA